MNRLLITKAKNENYEDILTCLDYETQITQHIKSYKNENHMKNKILVDSCLVAGMSDYRFIEIPFDENGCLNIKKAKNVSASNELLNECNNILKSLGEKYLKNSILTDKQKDNILNKYDI